MNFIFFMPDELRAESVGCYGHPNAITPNMDALAAEGVRFDQCHVQHPVCSPSRCSLMTGWYPHVRGHRTLWHLLRPDEPNLLRYLRQAGYDVIWYGKNDLLAVDTFVDCVTEATSHGSRLWEPIPFDLDDPLYYSFLTSPYQGPLEEHVDYANVQAAIHFLRGKPQRPFLLYLPLVFPHPPYGAPEPWHDQVDPESLPPLRPAGLPDKPDYFEHIRRSRRLNELDEADFRRINAIYLGMTSFIDHLLGQLLDALADSGLEDETTVFVFSDHGDYAGDYGLVEKWPNAMEDVITRVPLIVRMPGGAAGHIVFEPVELFDIMATVMELAGIEPRHTHFARSLVPQLHGAAGDPDRAVFCEGGYARHEPHCFEGDPRRDTFARHEAHIYYPKGKVQQDSPDSVGRTVMIRTTTHKLVYRPTGVCELYDLEVDPQELYNCYDEPAYAAVRDEMESRLLAWLVQTSDVTPFDEDPRGLPARG
ncbi:MAG TPA: sulfatase-like hydrolase/transferase [Caldilineae bacterium]|jgi:choline-sulfatase|nr:sulfatase-like hydrolase/transferase [Caldilineae bacterium]